MSWWEIALVVVGVPVGCVVGSYVLFSLFVVLGFVFETVLEWVGWGVLWLLCQLGLGSLISPKVRPSWTERHI